MRLDGSVRAIANHTKQAIDAIKMSRVVVEKRVHLTTAAFGKYPNLVWATTEKKCKPNMREHEQSVAKVIEKIWDVDWGRRLNSYGMKSCRPCSKMIRSMGKRQGHDGRWGQIMLRRAGVFAPQATRGADWK
eukprot:jgi/Tetstr1/420465/TSEL_011578.t1